MTPPARRHNRNRGDLLPTTSLVSAWARATGSAVTNSPAAQQQHNHNNSHSGSRAKSAAADFFDFKGAAEFVPTGKRQWLRYDDRGRMTVIPADKRPLVEELRLPGRDALMVNPLVPTPFPPAVLIRDAALVVNLGALRAVVGADRVFLLSVPDPASDHWAFPDPAGPFERELAARLAGVAEPVSASSSGLGGSTAPPVPPPPPSGGGEAFAHPSLAPSPSGADLLAAAAALAAPPPPPGALPYELRALEAALQAALGDLSTEAAGVAERTLPALEALAEGAELTRRGLERVRSSKLAIKRLEARILGLKRELEELINDDDDMRDMFLGRRAAAAAAVAEAAAAETATEEEEEEGGGAATPPPPRRAGTAGDTDAPPSPRPTATLDRSLSPRPGLRRRGSVGAGGGGGGGVVAGPLERLASAGWAPVPLEPGTLAGPDAGPQPVRAASHHDVAACESMLESYFMQADFLLSRLFVLKERIDDTEDLVGIELDSRRNDLVALQLLVTLLTSALAVVSTVGALLGMNLAPLPIETTVAPFWWITGGSIAGGVALFLFTLAYARSRRILWIPKVPRE